MKLTALAPALAACLLLAACADDATPAAPAPNTQTEAAAPADALTRTEAVYGDEAPVAIDAEPVADDHAHNADGSHAAGDEHAEAAHDDADPADDGDHPHADGEGDHTH